MSTYTCRTNDIYVHGPYFKILMKNGSQFFRRPKLMRSQTFIPAHSTTHTIKECCVLMLTLTYLLVSLFGITEISVKITERTS